MLANHAGARLSGLEISRHDQNAVGKKTRVLEDIEDHLVGAHLVVNLDLSGARIGREERVIESPDHLLGKVIAVELLRFRKVLRRICLQFRHEFCTDIWALDQQLLVVPVELV